MIEKVYNFVMGKDIETIMLLLGSVILLIMISWAWKMKEIGAV